MSQTYLAVIIGLLVTILPKLGITVGSDELTTTVTTIVQVASAVWILIRRYQAGGITVAGFRR